MAEVALDGVSKVYPDGTRAVDQLNLDVGNGEFMVLVGPSGCGKTTALRMVAGLEEISEGTVRIGDRIVNDLTPRERDIAMVFQSYALYPHLSVYDNIAFSLKLHKVPSISLDGTLCSSRSSSASRRRSRAASGSGWRWVVRSCVSRRRS
jgi:multiple sugar transport system ATP-binding protein